MDILRKLQSILSPGAGPVNPSYRSRPKAEGSPRGSFADTLAAVTRDGSDSAVFAVPNRRPSAVAEPPSITPSRPVTTGLVTEVIAVPLSEPEPPAGPVILPEVNPDGPLSPPEADTRETLADAAARELARGAAGEKAAQKNQKTDEVAPTATGDEGRPRPSTIDLLPPLGVEWVSMVLRGSGRTGPGIAGSDADTQDQLKVKVAYYSNPTQYGIKLNQEARLFLDAVDRGYVPKTAEGLGTLLAYLSKGSFGPDARPTAITAYLDQFYAAERAAGLK